jgi:hypothetical protein
LNPLDARPHKDAPDTSAKSIAAPLAGCVNKLEVQACLSCQQGLNALFTRE